MKKFCKNLGKFLLAWSLLPVICLFFFLLPLRLASACGEYIARLGARLPLRINHKAKQNIAMCFPEASAQERTDIFYKMWQHLGRNTGEILHISRSAFRKQVEVENAAYLEEALKTGRPIILCSGHIGNWESLLLISRIFSFPLAALYKPQRVALVDFLIRKIRHRFTPQLFAKNKQGLKGIIQHLQNGGHFIYLADQLARESLLSFFDRPAWTGIAIARLAVKTDAIMIPVRAQRLDRTQKTGKKHRISFYPPLTPTRQEEPGASPPDAATQALTETQQAEHLMQQMNTHMESWIRERPAQWIWFYKRWKGTEDITREIPEKISEKG